MLSKSGTTVNGKQVPFCIARVQEFAASVSTPQISLRPLVSFGKSMLSRAAREISKPATRQIAAPYWYAGTAAAAERRKAFSTPTIDPGIPLPPGGKNLPARALNVPTERPEGAARAGSACAPALPSQPMLNYAIARLLVPISAASISDAARGR